MEKNKLNIIDRLMLTFFIIQVFFIRWLNGKTYISYIGIVLIFIIIIRKKKYYRIKIGDVAISYIFISIIILNLISNGVKPLLIKNLYTYGIANIIVIIYILILGTENEIGLKNFILNDMFYIFNGYFIINVPILIKQLGNTYFLMRDTKGNTFYEDQITGLIGANGTHELTFYWIILILINIYRIHLKKEKILVLINILYIIFMITISSYNDNTAFFIIVPIILIQYMLKYFFGKKKVLFNIFKMLLIGLVLISLSGIVYNESKSVKQFVDSRVVEKLCQYNIISDNSKKLENNWNDDDERTALFKYALEYGDGYRFGKGIGSIVSYGDKSMPLHFGMSEISLRVYEGGIIYLCGYIIIFSYFLYRIFRINNNNRKLIGLLFITGDIVLFSVYTLVFRLPFFSFALSIITLLFNYYYRESKQL